MFAGDAARSLPGRDFGSGARDGFDRVDDCLMAGSAAVSARQLRPDSFTRWRAFLLQQLRGGQQHAGRAEAALQRVACRKCLLQIGHGAGIRDALDRLDPAAVALNGERQTAAHDRAVEQHRAGAAHAVLAADVAAGQPQILAQEVDQGLARLDALLDLLAVHAETDLVILHAHVGPAAIWCATRASSTPARWVFTAPLACTSSGGERSDFSASMAAASWAGSFVSTASARRARTGIAPTPK